MKKLIAVILSFSLLFGSMLYYRTPEVSAAQTQEELEAKSEEIDKQIKENEKKLQEIKNKKKSQQEYLNTLESQIETLKAKVGNIQTQMNSVETEITSYTAEISQLNKEIKQTEKQITKAEAQITQLETEIEAKADSLEEKLRSNYINGSESTIQILMGADSLASFLTRLEMMKRISENEKKVITDFKDTAETLKNTKELLEKDKTDLGVKKNEVSESRKAKKEKQADYKLKLSDQKKILAELEKQRKEVDSVIKNLDKSSSTYKNYISNLEAEKKAADAEINKILSEYYASTNQNAGKPTLPASNANPNGGSAPGNAYNSGDSWAWPIGDRWCYISSGYGNRDASISGWSFHGGIDLAGGSGKLHGAPVYATRGGKVITAVTSDTGYGIYVLIDHGGGYSSLYAHMSVRYVNVGDTVQKGQMIGRVGDTGNSDGAHLHFEIRYYGEKQDPLKFVKNPNK